MRYWIFQCNPRRFDIDRRLADEETEICWLVTRHKKEIAPGDVAFIWQAGPQRGIRAVMRIESAPTDMVDTEADAKYWTDTRDRRLACRVRGTLTDRFPVIGVDEIQAMPGLQNLSILRAPQGTNFSLSGQEADLLHKLTHQLGVI